MNENENIITIEDEIKEFSDKPVKSSAIFKALKESGGRLVVHIDEAEGDPTTDKTWQEICDVFSAGGIVVIEPKEGYWCHPLAVYFNDDGYFLTFFDYSEGHQYDFWAENPNDYLTED